MTLDYDPSREALLRPDRSETLFTAGAKPSDEALCVEASRLAYYRTELGDKEVRRLRDALGIVGFELAQTWHSGALVDAEGFAAYRSADNTGLLAFRGTEPDKLADLGTDADLVPVELPGIAGRVHRGFGRAFQALEERVINWHSSLPDGTRVIVCGHSLGAAIAMICAQRIRPHLLVTLGCPRTGDAGFVAALAGIRVVRIVDCCDLVTQIPPELPHYTHPKDFLYIDAQGSPQPNPTAAFVDSDRGAARIRYLASTAWRVGAVTVRDLADHAPHNYARAFF